MKMDVGGLNGYSAGGLGDVPSALVRGVGASLHEQVPLLRREFGRSGRARVGEFGATVGARWARWGRLGRRGGGLAGGIHRPVPIARGSHQYVPLVHVHARDVGRRVGDERLELLLEPNLRCLLRHPGGGAGEVASRCSLLSIYYSYKHYVG